MDHSDIPPKLYAELRATVADSSNWPRFCSALNELLGTGILFFGHNIDTNDSIGTIGAGFDPSEVDRYQSYFAEKNPWMHMDIEMPVGMVGISDQALSQRDLFKTEFYNDWLRCQDNVIGGSALMCYRSGNRFAAVAAACRARDYDDKILEAQAVLQTLSPHITQTIELAALLSCQDLSAAILANGLAHGVIQLRRSGAVAHVNTAAETFLKTVPGLAVSSSDRLVATAERFRPYVECMLTAISEMDCSKLPAPLYFSSAATGSCLLHAHIFPESSELSFPDSMWLDPVAGALVIASRQHQATQQGFARLAQCQGATPAEARLAEALVGGETLSEYADRKKLSTHTVRNQMRALLHKTGTKTQADFIRQLLQSSSPLLRRED